MADFPRPQKFDWAEVREAIVRMDLETQLGWLAETLHEVEKSIDPDAPWYKPAADSWTDMATAYEHFLARYEWEEDRDTYWVEG